MGPPGSFGFYWFNTLPTVGGGWFGSSSLYRKGFAPMRMLLSSISKSSPKAGETGLSHKKQENAPMKKPSIRLIAAQMALALGFWLCVLAGVSQNRSTNAIDIYVLADVTPAKTPVRTQFGKINSTTGAFTEISANLLSGYAVGNLAWNNAANSFSPEISH